jgi:hypothetical protein
VEQKFEKMSWTVSKHMLWLHLGMQESYRVLSDARADLFLHSQQGHFVAHLVVQALARHVAPAVPPQLDDVYPGGEPETCTDVWAQVAHEAPAFSV